ncbi:IS110 family transposase [Agarilytica rhodophyticola]|uniref:IS110 family transposase n=1 Tax=Agarilytica rhodophyticola TaxID=1737490 RepID=UPI000B348AF2|nr:IS110 family transposase [Agarilytica rhodophyticola]
MTIKVLGVDLGKHCFHVYGVDHKGYLVEKKRLTREKFLLYLNQLPPCLIGFEACGGAHYWAAKAKTFGHEAKLMPAQFVKPYLKSNKNDFLDAEAICEAVQRPNMRFVTIRNPEQQAIGAMVKTRNQLVQQRTAVLNQAHGFLLEYGIALKKGRGTRQALMDLTSQEDTPLPSLMRCLLLRLIEEYDYLHDVILQIEKDLSKVLKNSGQGKRLLCMPGIGVITAASLIAWVGDARHFRSGRELSAWIGLVPRQYSTGGKSTLLGIGKRGHKLLRCYLIHGARSVLQWHHKNPTRWLSWSEKLLQEKPKSKVVIALANKMVRTLWVILSKNERYQPSV